MRLLTLLLIALLTGCASGRRNTVIPQPREAFSDTNTPVVFECVVVERLQSPRVWAGDLASFQGVRYRVDSVTSGPRQPGERVVYHALVGPPLCERDEPVLSQRIFRVGQRLRVKAARTPAGDFVGWEQAENVKMLN